MLLTLREYTLTHALAHTCDATPNIKKNTRKNLGFRFKSTNYKDNNHKINNNKTIG